MSTTSDRRMFWRMLLAAMVRRRSRVAMAVLSSAVGAATLFCLTAVCLTVPAQMSAQMRQFGANLVVVPVAVDGTQAQLLPAQADAVIAAVTADAPARAAGYRYESVLINRTPYLLAGIDVAAVRDLNGHWDVAGEWPGAGEVLVGVDVAAATGAQVGSVLTIAADADHERPFRVAGIVETGAEEDDIVYTGLTDVAELTGAERGWDVLEFSVDTTAVAMDVVVGDVNAADPGVSARPVSKITTADTRIITMLGTLFWVVSTVVLALTLVGVSTTMTVIVSERHREIGLRKALGASSADISREFHTEALCYGVLGGLVGTAAGYGLAQLVSIGVFDRSVGFQPLVAAGSVAVAALVAVVAAYLPVSRASRIDPALVLREE